MEETEQDKTTRYLSKLEKHVERATDSAKYASDRFDILLISIAFTALVTTVGFTKTNDSSNLLSIGLLKFGWLCFVLTIITNLGSQITSYFANKYEIKATKNLIRKERGMTYLELPKQERASQVLNNSTHTLNLLSFCSLIVGIICVTLFYSKNI